MSRGVDHMCGSDAALLWLWHRLAAAVPIGPLAWELTYAMGAAQKKKKNWGSRHGAAVTKTDKSGLFVCFCKFAFSWAVPAAYGGSQARGRSGAVATGVHQSHSNAGSESCLQPIP